MIIQTTINPQDLDSWFQKQGFEAIEFEGKKEYISTFWLGQAVTFQLVERDGYTTYWKEAFGGSIIVFEVLNDGKSVKYSGYCPLLLFGLWNMKLSFKEKASKLFQYRKQGYEIEQEFKKYLNWE